MARPKVKTNLGEAAGRLLLQDITAIHFNHRNREAIAAENVEPRPISPKDKIQIMVNLIKTQDELDTYNEYSKAYDYLEKVPLLHASQKQRAELIFWKLYYLMNELYSAEIENSDAIYRPLIVTNTEYKLLKKNDIDRKLNKIISLETLIFDALDYYLVRYQSGFRTPLNKYFKKYENETATSAYILEQRKAADEGYYILPDGRTSYDMSPAEFHAFVEFNTRNRAPEDIKIFMRNLEWVENDSHLEPLSKLLVLSIARQEYYSEATGDPKTFIFFKADYPELFEALLQKLSGMKGLSFIKNMSDNEYFKPLIKYADLYRNKILNYRAKVETLTVDGYLGGVAVLDLGEFEEIQRGTFNVDEHGNYRKDNYYSPWRKEHMAEAFIKKYSNVIKTDLTSMADSLREAKTIETIVYLLSEYVNMPELNDIIEPAKTDQVVLINRLIDDIISTIKRYGGTQNEMTEEDVIAALKDILIKIDLDTLDPLPEDIKAAADTMEINDFINNAESLHTALKRRP